MLRLLSATDLQAKIAQTEKDRVSAVNAAEAEKKEFIDRISKPSGLSDDQLVEKASLIIARAVENRLTSVEVLRFPNSLCTDMGRAIDQGEAGWEETLTGIPKEIRQFWQRQLKPLGYDLKYQIADRPGGMRGDVAWY
ncbi:MAG: hypothetical protein WCP68_02670 [Enhydrobacter sp.]